ncbi:single-stranded DNA-binding protein [Micromonospora sp. WMMD734]|uniref:Single-stranded DNA-binding protein n=1 Tax=Micromonospora humidisoli TaxID=2807622 RepID=A0ABS2J8N0_9ACTN|nr:single-stranded DNA-binding protein [Micromonospora humidisoli]MBM7082925.1 single-stranded DNA-binding protein [Micromonospora humidisoli]
MFDTYVTIVGNVLTAPQWRRTAQSNTLVANFKVASTARRLNRDSGRWVDGNSLRVRVNCWRKLAEGVAASVMVGDPVVVAGRLYTRDWTDDAGNHRVLYELEAVAVGHDLSRGRSRFLRNRPSMATSTVEDAAAAQRVHGEPTEPVPADQVPVGPDDRPLDDDFDLPGFGLPQAGDDLSAGGYLPNDLSAGGYVPAADPFDDEPDDDLSPLPDDGPAARSDGGDRPGDAGGPGGGSRTEDDGPGGEGAAGAEGAVVPTPGEVALGPAGRGRRGRGRVPVPA